MDDEPMEERQERELDRESAQPEEANHDINFGIGSGRDVWKVWSDGIDSSGGISLHEETVQGRIEDAGSSDRGCHGDGEESIVDIEAFEAAIADDCPTYSNGDH